MNVRAFDAPDCGLAHSAEAGQPRAADDVHQDCLGLVVYSVPHCHGPRAQVGGDPRKEAVTEPAGRVLQGEAASPAEGVRVHTFRGEVEPEAAAGLSDEDSVGLGLCPPQAVVEMGGVEPQRSLPPRAGQGVKKGQGVWAARHSNDHQVARLQPATPRDAHHLCFEAVDQPLVGHLEARRAAPVRPAGRRTAS